MSRDRNRIGAWRRIVTVVCVATALVGGLALPAQAQAAPPDAPLTPEQQVAVDSGDPAVRVDDEGRPYVLDPLPRPRPRSGAQAAPTRAAAPFPYGDTFLLHSRPSGSQRTIYLDFDGGTITGTVWNGSEYDTPASFVAEPYSLDASASFSNAEKDAIQSIWQRVAEDFAPFNVDVTTEDPGFAAIDRANEDDQVYGTRAMISNTDQIYDKCDCAGAAYLDVFRSNVNHKTFQPAWIFPAGLVDTKDVAEVVSHEVGHTFGLLHDGGPSADYYDGHGAWAPIMGSGYYEPVVQWSKGEYPGANHPDPPGVPDPNTQDDLAMISANGAPLLADDHGGSAGTATPLSGSTSFAGAGIITTDADTDWFAVTVPAGALSFAATPAPNSPNLDIRLELRSADGSLDVDDPPTAQVTYDIASGLGAAVSAPVPAGTYFVKVEGVGSGNLTTGYSGYGSLGRYTLTGAHVPDEPVEPVEPEPYHPIEPERLLDTRLGSAVPVGTGKVQDLQVVGAADVPADASAVVLSVAVTEASAAGHLRVYPCTSKNDPVPTPSNVNYVAGQTVANLVITGLGSTGKVCFFAFKSTHVVVDLFGWYPAESTYTATTPARLLDTRVDPGQPVGTGKVYELQVAGQGGISASARVAVLSVAVTEASAAGHLRVYPCTSKSDPVPTPSNVNYVAGQTVANLVITGLGSTGKVCFFAFKSTHVVVDAFGWHPADGTHTAITPARLLDTRVDPGQPVGTGKVYELQVAGQGGIPTGTSAAILSVAVTEASAAGHLRVYPCTSKSDPVPTPSNVNYVAGQTVANLVITGVGSTGKVCFFAFKSTHVVVDAFGYDDA